MRKDHCAVRIIKSEPVKHETSPKLIGILHISPKTVWEKVTSILTGSGIGILAGIAIYYLLLLVGIDISHIESCLIIGLPSCVGIFTSYVLV
jgi:hypothetical protein